MIKTFIHCHPLDLLPGGSEAVLDLIHGELGANGLSVWLGHGATTRIRPPLLTERVLCTEGGLFFRPDAAAFEATRLKPLPSRDAPASDWLGPLHEKCREREMMLRGIISCGLLGRVARRHPDMACKNAFGMPSHGGLCLVNPDVRAFLVALVREMSRRSIFDSLVLADTCFHWPEAWDYPGPTSLPMGEVERAALSMCFCESCLQAAGDAGVDGAAARQSVTTFIDSFLEGAPPALSLADVADTHAALEAWLVWRGQALSSLWAELAEASTCDIVVALDFELARSAFAGLAYDAVDGVMQVFRTDDQSIPQLNPRPRRRELDIRTYHCVGERSAALVARLKQHAEAGFHTFHIASDAVFSETGRAAVRQAIRFAKRDA